MGARFRERKPPATARYNNPFFLVPQPTMNAPLTGSLLSAIELAPRDPILGVTDAFNADRNVQKVNLGVGVYCDDNGRIPLLECVKRAEREIAAEAAPRGYLPIDGIAAYDQAGPEKRFGPGNENTALAGGLTGPTLGGPAGLQGGRGCL